MKWAYGVTTVESRLDTYLIPTLNSLEKAGFEKPRLFVDDSEETCKYYHLGLPLTNHHPKLSIFGNWVLALWELYIREPEADRFALFQDDFITYKNLRPYLEKQKFPDKGYWNLYTVPQNQKLSNGQKGFYLSNQKGRGAVALVFNRDRVCNLLQHDHLVTKPQNALVRKRLKNLDGCISETMKKCGCQEFVHNPSLVQHTGRISSLQNVQQPIADNFLGEDFDALELLNG